MDDRTRGIVITVAAVLLCGMPGLISACLGLMFAFISQVPGAQIDIMGSSDPQSALNFGLGALCVGGLVLLIPVVVGVLALRRREPKPAVPPPPGYDEPLPPAS